MQTHSLNLPSGAHAMIYHFLSIACTSPNMGATVSAMSAQKFSMSHKQVWLLHQAVENILNPLESVRQNFSGLVQKVNATNGY